MKQTVKKVVAIVVGWVFIVLGVIGLFLPIMQGILFIIIGLTILSTEYVWAHHLLSKLRARFPKIAVYSDRARDKAAGWVRRAYGHEEAR
ncbi:MAG TPA: PGPGW domain-containing protein [Terriglobales bacterium]|nr:PGPGW domain-containing protein [Terriglobales bacterium]